MRKARPLLTFFLLFLATAQAQNVPGGAEPLRVIQFRNDDYLPHSFTDGGEAFVGIDGFESVTGEGWRMPCSRRTIEIDGDVSPRLLLAQTRYGVPMPGHPFFAVQYSLNADSSLRRTVRSLFGRRNTLNIPGIAIGNVKREFREGKTILHFSIPLLSWDERTSRTSFLESFSVSLSALPGGTRITSVPSQRPLQEMVGSFSAFPASFLRYVDTSGSWIDQSRRYIKFAVRSDTVYRLDKSWFEQQGVSTFQVSPSTVKLYLKGKEIPLAEKGMQDGTIDDGDYFLFYGSKNYGDPNYRRLAQGDEECPQYIDKYQDSTLYWLTWGGTAGARVGTNQPAQATIDSLTWYMNNYHGESDIYLKYTYGGDLARINYPLWTSEDTWIEGWITAIAVNAKKFYSIPVADLYPGINGTAYYKTGSWGKLGGPPGPAHLLSIALNQSPLLDSAGIDLGDQKLLSGVVPSQYLSNGVNQLILTSYANQGGDSKAQNQAILDWLDLEYPRYLAAVDNYLAFVVRDARMTGLRLLKSIAFTDSNIQVMRIRGDGIALLPRRMLQSGNGFACLVQDTVALGDRYIFYNDAVAPRAPTGLEISFANLRNPSRQADYLIVTAAQFKTAAQSYADFVTQKYGVASQVVLMEDLYNEFGYGYFAVEPLKAFLYWTQKFWSAPAPRYVLLLGDANYDYRKPAASAPFTQNFVPSFGFPVSDAWLACFDSAQIHPMLRLGRLPVRSADQIGAYMEKHRQYLSMPYDDWNKTFIFYTGGNAELGQSALDDIHQVNQRIMHDFILPAPVGGYAWDFYKTITPMSSFGPVTTQEYERVLDRGALMIGYIGHSGTETWDNGIGAPEQLANRSGREPLIIDMGCSTGKFAEPDITCFGELFSLGAHAMAYIGNSTLGFTSLSRIFPYLFFTRLFSEGVREIAEAHRLAKNDLIERYGDGLINRIGILGSTYFGDPILTLPVPAKPNAVLKSNWPRVTDPYVSDKMDSLHLSIPFANWGKATGDTLEIALEDYLGATLLTADTIRRPLPLFSDTLRAAIPVKAKAGQRTLRITLDPRNRIDELLETDNTVDFPYEVVPAFLQALNTDYLQWGTKPDSLTLLNPVVYPGDAKQVRLDFDRSLLFSQPLQRTAPYGRVFSRLKPVPILPGAPEVYWRAGLDISGSEVAGPFHFRSAAVNRTWIQDDSVTFAGDRFDNLERAAGGYQVPEAVVKLRVYAAGAYDGNFSVIERNGFNVLPSTYGYQYYVAVLDSVTLAVKRTAQYVTWGKAEDRDSLNAFLGRVVPGEICVITTGDEPAKGKGVFIDQIRSLGSRYIDSVGGWESWAIIGRRGAATGTVPEGYLHRFQGRVEIDTTIAVPQTDGILKTGRIGPAAKWRTLYWSGDAPPSTRIRFGVFGYTAAESADTLLWDLSTPDSLDLSPIDASKYRTISLQATLAPGPNRATPNFRSWGVNYDFLPELALNYQSVSSVKDSIPQGQDYTASIGVVNPSSTPAGPFDIQIESVDKDNNRLPVKTLAVSGLKPDEWYNSQVTLSTTALAGATRLIVTVDPDNRVAEQFENNNTFSLPFFVTPDTGRPSMEVTFDGAKVLDGDFVRPVPEVRLALFDKGPYPVTGLENFRLIVDDTLLTPRYDPSLRFEPGSGLLKGSAVVNHPLTDGEHVFKFNVKDANGNYADTIDLTLRVVVERASKVIDFYNFPNPFAGATTFSFILTGAQPPDDFRIKVYTIAGRLIREIALAPSQLRIGYNTIQWDGRDADGDRLGSGVYFYKVLTASGGGNNTFIGKIAVVR